MKCTTKEGLSERKTLAKTVKGRQPIYKNDSRTMYVVCDTNPPSCLMRRNLVSSALVRGSDEHTWTLLTGRNLRSHSYAWRWEYKYLVPSSYEEFSIVNFFNRLCSQNWGKCHLIKWNNQT